MENIHPALNSSGVGHGQAKPPAPALALAVPNAGLDRFVDIHYEDAWMRTSFIFLLRTGLLIIYFTSRYRMHLRGKMASQHQHQHFYQQSPSSSSSHSPGSSRSSSPSTSSSTLATSLRL